MNKCLITGCKKRVHTRDRCHKHNLLFVEATNPLKCKKLDCNRGQVRNNFCNTHYKQDRAHNIPRSKFSSVRATAKNKGKAFTLSFEQWSAYQDLPCYYCSDKLKVKTKIGVGLDRIDNNKGYNISNVVPCCMICNKIRNTYLTPEETKEAVLAIINHRTKFKT